MSLSSQQLEAVALLGSGSKTIEVSTRLGITQRTIQRWRKSDEFASALKKISQETTRMVVQTTSFDLFKEIEKATQSSVELLKQFVEDPDLRPSDRLRAVDIVRRWGDQHRFEVEIERQLTNMIRRLEKLMPDDAYQDLLTGLTALGHDELETFSKLGHDS